MFYIFFLSFPIKFLLFAYRLNWLMFEISYVFDGVRFDAFEGVLSLPFLFCLDSSSLRGLLTDLLLSFFFPTSDCCFFLLDDLDDGLLESSESFSSTNCTAFAFLTFWIQSYSSLFYFYFSFCFSSSFLMEGMTPKWFSWLVVPFLL